MADQESLTPTTPEVGPTPDQSSFAKAVLLPATAILGILLIGASTGWFLSSGGEVRGLQDQVERAPGAEVSFGGKEVGLDDKETFRDNAEGILEKDGLDGEGTHHLVRDGGETQYVYLTSSVVDLSDFVGRKVEVWGETVSAQKVGWLMDVGRVKVLE
ncbi:hypothetical protein CMO96_03670 [Candidatus Woesebacteria bacterium]|nr:hypothetical protein [Candidatus Woesebacteria bacterium]|tara:strand:- start:424 stop:897 length:474 start_codon:yes stop_codon:yes gene_type:complete